MLQKKLCLVVTFDATAAAMEEAGIKYSGVYRIEI